MKIYVGSELRTNLTKKPLVHAAVTIVIPSPTNNSLVERFPSRPSPAACSASSTVYTGSRSCLHRRLCTLLRQCDLSALSVS